MFNLPLYPIATQELSADATSVTFTLSDYTIPSWAVHLAILYSARSDRVTTAAAVVWNLNGDSANNYREQGVDGNSTTASAARGDSRAGVYTDSAGASNPTSMFGGGYMLFPDYADTTRHKSVMSMNGNAEIQASLKYGRWASTAAITSITASESNGDNFITGSRFTLFAVDERFRVQVDVKTDDRETSFDFQNIPSVGDGYGELSGISLIRTNRAATTDEVKVEFNADTTATNYNRQQLDGTNSGLSAQTTNDNTVMVSMADSGSSAAFGAGVFSVSQYALTNDYPHGIWLSGLHNTLTTARGVFIVHSNRWANASAINRFTLKPTLGTTFMTGSAVWLYYVPRGHRGAIKRDVVSGNSAITLDVSDLVGEALVVNLYSRGNVGNVKDSLRVAYNSDATAANYDRQALRATATAIAATRGAYRDIGWITGNHVAGNIYGGTQLLLIGFSKTDRHKHVLSLSGADEQRVGIVSQRWESLAAITSIALDSTSAVFVADTVAEVWAIPSVGFDTVTRKTKAAVT